MKVFAAPLGSYELIQEMCDFIIANKYVTESDEIWQIKRFRNICESWSEELITETLPVLYEVVRSKGNFVVRITPRKDRDHLTLFTQEELVKQQISLEERYLTNTLTFSESVQYIMDCVKQHQCKGADKQEMLRNLVIAGILNNKGELQVEWKLVLEMDEDEDID